MQVQVLTWSHKHGRDVTVHATEKLAYRAGAAIVADDLQERIDRDYPDYRVGTDHEEDVTSNRAHCRVCGWLDDADPTKPVVMEYYGDSFPEQEPRAMIEAALGAGRHEDAIRLWHELLSEDDDITIEPCDVEGGDDLQQRAARVVNEWHDDDLTSDAVADLAELVPAELLPCDCGGNGWFVMERADTGQPEIQRCDDCASLTDEQAQALPDAQEALRQAEEEACAAEMVRSMRSGARAVEAAERDEAGDR